MSLAGAYVGQDDRMALYALGDLEPTIASDAYVHPDAVIIGEVHIGSESSIWPGVVIRGDSGPIKIGARTSIQDGSVLHTTYHAPTTVGDDCVVGHMVHLEGCTIEDGALVGSGSVVLHNAIVRSGGLVGANAVCPDGFEVPARRGADEYASSHHSDIGPDGPGIVDDEDDYPEERPEEEPGRDYPSDLEDRWKSINESKCGCPTPIRLNVLKSCVINLLWVPFDIFNTFVNIQHVESANIPLLEKHFILFVEKSRG